MLGVGDIDRGRCLAPALRYGGPADRGGEKAYARLIINKFRGDRSILEPGFHAAEDSADTGGGVVPHMDVDIEDEGQPEQPPGDRKGKAPAAVDLAVIRFRVSPILRILMCFQESPEYPLRYVDSGW